MIGFVVCRLMVVMKLVYYGMIFVLLGYMFGKGMYEMGEVKGGLLYGLGIYVVDGLCELIELEIE